MTSGSADRNLLPRHPGTHCLGGIATTGSTGTPGPPAPAGRPTTGHPAFTGACRLGHAGVVPAIYRPRMRTRLRRAVASTVAVALGLPVAALAPALATPAPAGAAVPTELFFSEYVEGSGFNKAVEIFNGTGAPVDLAAGGYTLELYSNGSATPSQSVALTGTVAAGDVFVVSRADADPALVARADQLAPAVANWNGDDAVALRRGGGAVDVIGQIGVDPATEWGSGLPSTADNTIRRLPTVAGTAATRTVTATDPDGTVVDIAVTAVEPAPAAGSITRTALTPAASVGGTAEAVVTVDATVPA